MSNIVKKALQRAANIIDSIAYMATEGADITQVSTDEAKTRMDICRGCDKLGSLNKCGICGCFMDVKTKLVFDPVESFKQKAKVKTVCPAGKW